MSDSPRRARRERLIERLAALARVDRWPSHVWPRLERAREVLAFARRRAAEVRLAQVAASLTFTTTLSIVPLAAVGLSLFAAFPLFADFRVALEEVLLKGLLPPQVAATILRYLNDFAANAAGLTAAGLLFLVATALLMIHTVDEALNDIWGASAYRRLPTRLLVYWALLTLGPLVVGASLSASSYVLGAAASGGPLGILLDGAPFVLGGFALAALYVVVPTRRVAWRDALIGGFIASAVGELLRWGFGLYLRTGTITGIYGAFSAVPLFLLWVYLSWYALLFGAAIAATAPMLRATRFADERRAGDRFVTAVALLAELLRARQRGGEARMATAELAFAVRMAVDRVEGLLAELERLGYVSRLAGTHAGSRDELRAARSGIRPWDGPAGSWLLTCDPGTATLRPLFERLAVDPGNSLLAAQPEVRQWLDAALQGEWLQQPLAAALGGQGQGCSRVVPAATGIQSDSGRQRPSMQRR